MPQHVFVGDVQGCFDELSALLDRARAELGSDFELLFTGDLVNRGPESFRVLERVRALADAGRARTVLGNHDLRLLSVALGASPRASADTFGDVLGRSDCASWIDWLRRQPLLIDGVLGGTPFALVHASLAPGWSLERARELAAGLSERLGDPSRGATRAFLAGLQRARGARATVSETSSAPGDEPATLGREIDALGRLISARTATPGGGWSEKLPEEVPGGEPWHAAWARAHHGFGVVYGHWALQRLHVAPRLRGLDTGCVHHGRGTDGFLTGWIPNERSRDPFAVPDSGFWHVPARRRYGK